MDLTTYEEQYLPGTRLYVAETPSVIDGIPYDGSGFNGEDKALYINHKPKKAMHDIGVVIGSRIQTPDIHLHVFAEQYHPLFVQGVGEYLQLDSVTPYAVETPHGQPILAELEKEDSNQNESTSQGIFGHAKNLVNDNPTLEAILTILENESL